MDTRTMMTTFFSLLRFSRHGIAFGDAWLAAIIAVTFCCTATIAGEAHLLRAGDVLEIKVFEHSELDLSARVQQDGTIRMPLCGKVNAEGTSAGALAETLSTKLETNKIEDAFVTVFVTKYAPRPVFVVGEVKDGGVELQIPAQGRLSVMQAISSAGGFSETANKTAVGILRLQADGTSKRLSFDAARVVGGEAGAGDLRLQPGDTILVARATPVSVFGMVNKPGIFPVDTGAITKCSELLCRAGGLKADADLAQVMIMRGTGGKPVPIRVDVDAVLNGDLRKDADLKPGDVIVVNAKDQVFVLGEVKTPGSISLDRKVPLTLARAISQVGGVTNNANRRSILIFRDDKTIEINLRLILSKGRDVKDLQLQAGDVVFVPESIW